MNVAATLIHHVLAVLQLQSSQVTEFGAWTYFLLAFLVLIEGPIAVLAASAAASAGLMRPGLVFLSAAVGNLAADSLWWLLGYSGKPEWIHSIGRRLKIRESLIEHLKHSMVKHATRVMFVAKLTLSFSVPTLIAAGLLRIPWRRWFPWFVLAETLWTGSLVLIGYYTTLAIKHVAEGMEFVLLGASVIFVIVLFLWGRRLLKRLEQEEDEEAAR
ncbi:MAG TPA: VTT domain-containing protein [Anaerolineales bacterium]